MTRGFVSKWCYIAYFFLPLFEDNPGAMSGERVPSEPSRRQGAIPVPLPNLPGHRQAARDGGAGGVQGQAEADEAGAGGEEWDGAGVQGGGGEIQHHPPETTPRGTVITLTNKHQPRVDNFQFFLKSLILNV